MAHRGGDHLVHRGRIANIANLQLANPAVFTNLVADPFQVFRLAAGNQHRSAIEREFARDSRADSGAATGHNRNLALDAELLHIHLLTSF